MTPFDKAGFTEETEFKVLKVYGELKVGDIVTIYLDNDSSTPIFSTQDNRTGCMYLPEYGFDLEEYNNN